MARRFLSFFFYPQTTSTVACFSSEPSLWGYLYLIPFFVVVFALTLLFVERKLIAIAQKRLGISFLGRNG
jgi:NADH:ubiquinone oxidoreductase subunit H